MIVQLRNNITELFRQIEWLRDIISQIRAYAIERNDKGLITLIDDLVARIDK